MQTGSTLQEYLSMGRTDSMMSLKDKLQPKALRSLESQQHLHATENEVKVPGKMRSFAIRTASTVFLIGGFLTFLWAGHVPLMFLVLILQVLMVKEVFNLGKMDKEEDQLPGFRALQWFFFWVRP